MNKNKTDTPIFDYQDTTETQIFDCQQQEQSQITQTEKIPTKTLTKTPTEKIPTKILKIIPLKILIITIIILQNMSFDYVYNNYTEDVYYNNVMNATVLYTIQPIKILLYPLQRNTYIEEVYIINGIEKRYIIKAIDLQLTKLPIERYFNINRQKPGKSSFILSYNAFSISKKTRRKDIKLLEEKKLTFSCSFHIKDIKYKFSRERFLYISLLVLLYPLYFIIYYKLIYDKNSKNNTGIKDINNGIEKINQKTNNMQVVKIILYVLVVICFIHFLITFAICMVFIFD